LETIAVYWENKIKTYGFQIRQDLSLFHLTLPPAALSPWGALLLSEKNDITFDLVLMQTKTESAFGLYLLLQKKWEQSLYGLLNRMEKNSFNIDCNAYSPVELLHFQGPHFGDRYGIADKVFFSLSRESVPMLGMGCTAASVYIIFPEHEALRAKKVLAGVFETPEK
jgi:hypothetical protein